eukprot:m.277846 g.277846  ORF g.277846 m.277846 type:complete len:81 (-) comp19791_c0_seq8:351-593(-)
MGFGAAAKAGKRVLFPTEIYPLAVFLSGALLGGTMFGFKKLNEVTTSVGSSRSMFRVVCNSTPLSNLTTERFYFGHALQD